MDYTTYKGTKKLNFLFDFDDVIFKIKILAPSVIVEENKEYLHSEVGIDKDLEKLLAEDPGLYMEDDSTSTARSHNGFNQGPRPAPSVLSNSSPFPKR